MNRCTYVSAITAYNKWQDFELFIVNFRFLDGDSFIWCMYIYQPIRHARVLSHVCYFNNRNNDLTTKLLKQGGRYNNNNSMLGFYELCCYIHRVACLSPSRYNRRTSDIEKAILYLND